MQNFAEMRSPLLVPLRPVPCPRPLVGAPLDVRQPRLGLVPHGLLPRLPPHRAVRIAPRLLRA